MRLLKHLNLHKKVSQFSRSTMPATFHSLIQYLKLVARVNMTLVRIVLIEKDVIGLLDTVPLQKDKRAAQVYEGSLIYACNRVESAADELIDYPGSGCHMRFPRELIHKFLRQWGAVEGTQQRGAFRAKQDVGAHALGALLGAFDEPVAQAHQSQDQRHR